MLGVHWFLEGRVEDVDRLSDTSRLQAVLREVPASLGLTVLTSPAVHASEEVGTVGLVMLAESHFTVRCLPEECRLWADLFSCRDVDFGPARDRLVDSFGLRDVRESTVERTLHEQ